MLILIAVGVVLVLGTAAIAQATYENFHIVTLVILIVILLLDCQFIHDMFIEWGKL